MGKYIYTDNKTKTIVFECDATDITEADKLFQTNTNINPTKAPYIGCQIIKK